MLDHLQCPGSITAWISDGALPETIDSPLYLVGGHLRINENDTVFKKQLQDPEAQVVTVAIHLNMGLTSSAAVTVAGEILEKVSLLND